MRGKKIFLQTSQDSDSLVKDINSLGGTVCQFLSKHVDYVVIDSFDKLSRQEQTDVANNKGSRAQILLAKALKSTNYKQQQKSLQEKSREFGFKIISVPEFKKNILTEIATSKEKESIAAEPKQERAIVRSLKPPFIKVEDHSGRYRPLFKEFDVWPSFDFESSTDYDVGGNRKEKNHTRKQEIVRFCECCECHFTNFDEHLQSKQHRSFAENDQNYESLDKVIKRGPSLDDYLKKVKERRAQDNKNTAL